MNAQKQSIVAIHGAGMHGAVWDMLHDLNCQTLSLPGHKKDSGAPLSSIEEMAAWAGEQLDPCSENSIMLMGHSMGALVAMEMAQLPAVGALVLMGASAAMPVHPDLLRQTVENPDAAMDMILKWGVNAAHPDAASVRALLKGHMLSAAPGALAHDMNACNNYKRGAETAGKITKPVLVLSAELDKMARAADGKALADLIRNAKYQALPDCGHMMMAEKPAEVTQAIRGFID